MSPISECMAIETRGPWIQGGIFGDYWGLRSGYIVIPHHFGPRFLSLTCVGICLGVLNPVFQLRGGWGACPQSHGFVGMNSWFCPVERPILIKNWLFRRARWIHGFTMNSYVYCSVYKSWPKGMLFICLWIVYVLVTFQRMAYYWIKCIYITQFSTHSNTADEI